MLGTDPDRSSQQRAIDDLWDRAENALRAGDLVVGRSLLMRVTCLAPAEPRGLYNLALLHHREARMEEAIRLYHRVLRIQVDHAAAGNNLCDALLASDDAVAADTWAGRFTELVPENGRAWNNLGITRRRLNHIEQARRAFVMAQCLAPERADPINNLALLIHGRAPDSALLHYRRALIAGARDSSTRVNLGTLLQEAGRLEEAERLYRSVLAEWPGHLDADANLAACLLDRGRADDALMRAKAVLARDPDHRRAQWLVSWVALMRRDFHNGYQHFDRKWQEPEFDAPAHAHAYPLWRGDVAAPGRLLLWCEHGVGDEILFAGLIGDVLAGGSQVVLECDPRLVTLFARAWPNIEVMARGGAVPNDVTAQSSTARLPRLFRRSLEEFPRHFGYLTADPVRLQTASQGLRQVGPSPRVGLAWRSGNPRTGAGKSTTLSEWEAVLAIPEVTRVSLQYDDGGEADPRLMPNPWPDVKGDIEGLAAQIAALDEVVTISGLTAHLAGALGVPARVMLPPTPVWFWFADGADCPWYPSLSLYRPNSAGDRSDAIESVARDLLDR